MPITSVFSSLECLDFSKIILVMQYFSLGWVKKLYISTGLRKQIFGIDMSWVGKKIWSQNSFSSAPTPAINNDRSLRQQEYDDFQRRSTDEH